ncbi:CidA/LrgA family holin-like protein [Lentibacillus saliphilus]|uniref:CidA/LrgA family holin-like protein n=1 Tax=Lentibacillus saliphilus TaxID=2737028 RepID=UPI001C2F57C0|nr:CidA/LrgA family holin-like protein [Lentibacillus saliphilus]
MLYVKKLLQALLLFGFFLVGAWLKELLDLPLSGSIIGLLLLLVALTLNIIPLKWVESGAYMFLGVLPLFFIPALIGVVNYGEFFAGKGLLLIPITVISTLMTMAAGGWVSQWLTKQARQKRGTR